MIRTILALLLVAPLSPVLAQTVPISNASFDEGTDQPAGWQLVGPSGRWLNAAGPDGSRAIAVTGSGNDSSYWQSPPLDLKPSTLYRLTFRARSLDARGGTATTGPTFCNRDLGSVPSQWTTYESIFITPANLRPNDTRLRFGQWHVTGTIAFDDIQLSHAMPVFWHSEDPSFDLWHILLGQGEMVRDSEYTFDAPFRTASRNHSRPLVSHTCSFNTDRWLFSKGDHVTYHHGMHARGMNAATVSVSVTWHQRGQLFVEASNNGADWTPLGSIDKVASQTFKVPADLGGDIWVRLRAGDDANTTFQVGNYSFHAKLNMEDPPLIGRTHFFAVASADPRLDVTFDTLDDALPGGYNTLVAHITNKTPQPIALSPTLTVTSGSSSSTFKPGNIDPRDPNPEMLKPGMNFRRIDYQLPGSGSHDMRFVLGDFTATTVLDISDLHATSYGQLLPASTADNTLWWASSGWKISDTRPAPSARSEAMLIRTARNEVEAAQLVIRPKHTLQNFTARAEALTGPEGAAIPAEAVEILRVRYTHVTNPTDATGAVGYWPDPLPPLASPIKLPENYNQPLWVRVKAPRDARPGLYTGRILLNADGYSAQVPLTVEVYDFTLPDRMTCQTAFGFSPSEVWRYQKLANKADRRAVLEKYWANFSAHHISPYDPTPLDRLEVTWPDRKSFVPSFDFAAWDAAMDRAISQYHFNTFRLSIPGMGGGTFHDRVDPELLGYKENQPEYSLAFNNYCKSVESHLRQKGWLDEAFIYWFDEPDPKDYAFVNNGFRKLKQAAPGLRRMLTEQVEPALVGGPNIWCPVSDNYNHEAAELRRREGESFWWYVCTGPKAPYCTLFIDHPATEMRVWLWQTFQRNIDGILVWQTNYWTSNAAYPDPKRPQNPYADPMGWMSGYSTPAGMKRPWGNGDGRFIYPPEAAANANPPGPILDGPVDSVRWEMLRDGIEDYEYLVVLRNLIQKKADKLSPEQRKTFTALLQVPPEITTDMTTFTKDPAPIERRRHQIAQAIAELEKR